MNNIMWNIIVWRKRESVIEKIEKKNLSREQNGIIEKNCFADFTQTNQRLFKGHHQQTSQVQKQVILPTSSYVYYTIEGW